MKFKLLFFLTLVLVLIKSVLWTVMVPVFHGPDEQSHFAQQAYMIEKHALTLQPENNLSQEILETEKLLGVYRDESGNNKFTYHPEYNIEYSDLLYGKHENEIKNIPWTERLNMVGSEASGYPPLYYLLSSPFYYLTYYGGVIDRLFAGRVFSVILQLGIFLGAYKIGIELWGKKIQALGLGIMVSFQPMISFVGGSYHPDNLLFVIFGLFILVCLQILNHGLNPSRIVELILLSLLGLLTKVFMIFLVPPALAVFLFSLVKNPLKGIFLVGVFLVSTMMLTLSNIGLPYLPYIVDPKIDLIDYLRFRIPKMLFEVWPWYWGVFRWLSLVLPIQILRIITRVAGFTLVGAAIHFIVVIKNKDIRLGKKFLFTVLSSAIYIIYFLIFDFRSMQRNGFSVGIQGRYFLPLIFCHMAVFQFGWNVFFKNKLSSILPVAMCVLNVVSWWVVARSYYDLSKISIFLTQFAQYKPTLIKDTVSILLRL